MCVIVAFKPKQMINKEALVNACHNNWHSYGIVTKVDGRLDIHRHVPESGEINPEEIYERLQKDFEHERFLHVRHNTAGATSLENTHPFDILYDEKTGNQVVLMHNGTFYDYKSKMMNERGVMVDDDDGPSDTKNFADRILIPYTAADFGSGIGDITNRLYVQLVNKLWPSAGTNRGLLISSKTDPLFIGDWKELGEEGNKLKVSNLDYFEKLTRGPEFQRRSLREAEEKKAREAKEAALRKQLPLPSKVTSSISSGVVSVTSLASVKVNQQYDFFELSKTMKSILLDWDVWDRPGMVSLGYATNEELEKLHENKTDCVQVMDLVFTDYAKMNEELEKEKGKNERASKIIADLKGQIERMHEARKKAS